MRKLAILLASVAALAVTLWLFQSGSADEPELATPDAVEANDAEDATALDAPHVETGVSNGAREPAEPAVEPTQHEEVVAKSARARTPKLHILVRDAQTGLPIEGAALRDLGHRPAVGTVDFTRRFWAPFGKTDANGRFDKQLEPTDSRYVSVERDGYGPCAVSLMGRHEAVDDPFVIELERSATLIGRFTGLAMGADSKGKTTVTLETTVSLVRGDREGGRNNTAGASSWRAEFGEDEAFRIEGLPPRVALEVRVRGASISFATLMLSPGEVREVDFTELAGLCVLRGHCLGPDGAPVAGTFVSLRAERAAMFASRGMVRRAIGRTAANGEFTIENIPPGKWQVVAHPTRTTPSLVGTTARVVVLEAGSEAEVRIDYMLSLGLAGRVVDQDGQPLAQVEVKTRQDGVLGSATSTVNGTFESTGLRAGPVSVWLDPSNRNSFARHAPQTFQAGDQGIVLRLARAASLRVQCLDGRGGTHLAAMVQLFDALQEGEVLRANCESGASCEFEGLRAETYDLCATTADGRVAVRRGVVLNPGKRTEVDLVVRVGGTLNYVYHGADRGLFLRCKLGETHVAQTRIRPGSDQSLTLPVGLVTLEVLSRLPLDESGFEIVEESTVSILAGQSVRVVSEATR